MMRLFIQKLNLSSHGMPAFKRQLVMESILCKKNYNHTTERGFVQRSLFLSASLYLANIYCPHSHQWNDIFLTCKKQYFSLQKRASWLIICGHDCEIRKKKNNNYVSILIRCAIVVLKRKSQASAPSMTNHQTHTYLECNAMIVVGICIKLCAKTDRKLSRHTNSVSDPQQIWWFNEHFHFGDLRKLVLLVSNFQFIRNV